MKLEAAVYQKYRLYRISGCVGWEDARLLDLELQNALHKDGRLIAIQLESIKHLSSSAIGVVVDHIRRSPERNGLYLLSDDNYVRELFELTGLPLIIPNHILRSLADFSQATGLPCGHDIQWTVQLDTWNQKPAQLCV